MKHNDIWNNQNLVKILKSGVVVMPTDTIYGIVGSALSVSAVNRVYDLRRRAPEKPCIILIGDVSELEKFSITLSEAQKKKIKEFTEPTSFILDLPAGEAGCSEEKFAYLHCGTKTLAFRLPQEPFLRKMLLKTGPLIAPSANTEGLPSAQNIAEAKKYFDDGVDLYIDGGEIKGKASRIVKLHKDGLVDILRN